MVCYLVLSREIKPIYIYIDGETEGQTETKREIDYRNMLMKV